VRPVSDAPPLPPAEVDRLCVTLDALIRLKRAAGRRKDLEAIAELEAIQEEREKTGLR
jgi:hypothetical protein